MWRMRSWSVRRWVVAGVAGLLAGVAGVVVVPPTEGGPWWEVPALVGTAALSGLVVASYIRDGSPGAGLRSAWDSGCTSCGRIALAAIPVALVIRDSDPSDGTTALLALLLLTGALARRLVEGTTACETPPAPAAPGPARQQD